MVKRTYDIISEGKLMPTKKEKVTKAAHDAVMKFIRDAFPYPNTLYGVTIGTISFVESSTSLYNVHVLGYYKEMGKRFDAFKREFVARVEMSPDGKATAIELYEIPREFCDLNS